MSPVTTHRHGGWAESASSMPAGAAEALEAGNVLFLPALAFDLLASELGLLSPAVASTAKNVSFDPRTGRLRGAALGGASAAELRDLVARFSNRAATLVGHLLPRYRDRVEIGRTSFRPVEIEGRASSWRKDDTRLHIDSFPATPVHGKRILRVFSNVNPQGRPRTWRIGDDFEQVARRFAGLYARPLPGSAALLSLLRITKSRRSPYDAMMLQLHDRMKADAEYQKRAPQTRFEFPSGSTWMAFTDQVSHAAMAGQYQLEQTFLLPVEAMFDERRSPLRILERIMGRALI